ncbi:alpha/beta fold hydrolase [Haloplanus aerogenes]|uniref:Alpha/beta hydrolase n=1 Tax=Haloplanus aerogenes TaxID=660522 RepID=A0A3M0DSS5_9EURY|nr:alpha/beta hydrolase [Haloplanus aerogenes]AZH25388.1 alpha/beta hydrolase [Haloplanus aerogenes]RMB25091.1 pimeloyl-ACP methyl ester carboxylesterase [Haloplanus aerogenes]
MAYFETNDGVPIYYTDRGEGDPILLIHGWTMNSTYWWQRNVDALVEAGYQVVAMDLRGHGKSGKTDAGHTLAQYGRDVRELIEHLDLTGVTPVGWSMGTAVILNYVDQFGTDGLEKVVFVDQSPKFHTDEEWDHALLGEFSGVEATELATNLECNRASAAKPFVQAMFAEEIDDALVDEMYAETTKTPTSVTVDIFLDMTYSDLRPVVSEVDVPALLIYGEQSDIFPTDVGGWLEDAMPDATHVPFADSGHCPFWEEAERFNEELARFV